MIHLPATINIHTLLDEDVQIRFAIEILISFAIIGILTGIAVSTYKQDIYRSRVIHAIHWAQHLQGAYNTQHTFTGAWRIPAQLPRLGDEESESAQFVTDIEFFDRGWTMHLSIDEIRPYKLSFRIAEGQRINWLCGYQEPLPGHTAALPNVTDVPEHYLPRHCRRST